MTARDEWSTPDALVARWAHDEDSAAWTHGLPAVAARLADLWGLRPDGRPSSGFNSAVWPVRRTDGSPAVLKVTRPAVDTGPEVTALRHWDASGAAVRLLARDPLGNALLLERLDPSQDLETWPDVDQAVDEIASLLARLPARGPALGGDPPDGLPTAAEEAARMAAQLRERGAAAVPAPALDRAQETFMWLQEFRGDRVLHFDAHFLNVLRAPTGGWRLIDPLARIGPVEWEPVALLRNRWADAVATGDPDRALRRRVDQVAERLGADRSACRAVAQAVAVDNLAWLTEHDPDHFFVPPYTVMAAW